MRASHSSLGREPRFSLKGLPNLRNIFLLNPDFYETQPQKPHNEPKKTQMMLREKRLRPELKLGGESDNPTSKGIP